MMTPIFILTIILLLALGGGGVAWFLFRRRRGQTGRGEGLSFRWNYIVLPVLVLLLSLALVAGFYTRLPAEVAYHFNTDGSPDGWLSREAAILWMVVPQVLLTLLAAAIPWGVARIGILTGQKGVTGVRPETILSLMGNMVALPQFILCFALADIFSYNSYQRHIMPLWVFAIVIAGLGAIILTLFFILAFRRVRGAGS